MGHIMLPSLPGDVTHLPVTHCQICDRTLAYRPGNISEVLTAHYRRVHPEALDIPSRVTSVTAHRGQGLRLAELAHLAHAKM